MCCGSESESVGVGIGCILSLRREDLVHCIPREQRCMRPVGGVVVGVGVSMSVSVGCGGVNGNGREVLRFRLVVGMVLGFPGESCRVSCRIELKSQVIFVCAD